MFENGDRRQTTTTEASHTVSTPMSQSSGELKTNKREVTEKVRKGEQSFLHATCCLDLIHTAMWYRPDITCGYLVMVCTRRVLKK